MIKEFVEKWDKYKSDLEDYFKNTTQDKYASYEEIVRLLFEKVINRDMEWQDDFDIKNILKIDDGDYQGTQIFILHRNSYQPSIGEYVYTNTYYGSCSGCDTLQAIWDWNYDALPDEKPDENQVKDYMQLALHLLQKLKFMGEDNEI